MAYPLGSKLRISQPQIPATTWIVKPRTQKQLLLNKLSKVWILPGMSGMIAMTGEQSPFSLRMLANPINCACIGKQWFRCLTIDQSGQLYKYWKIFTEKGALRCQNIDRSCKILFKYPQEKCRFMFLTVGAHPYRGNH